MGSNPVRVTIFNLIKTVVGDDCVKGTPVPIPNTEVKLIRAEDTWRAAARENRALPTSVFNMPT